MENEKWNAIIKKRFGAVIIEKRFRAVTIKSGLVPL